jgi:hypothetical protein
MSRSRCTALLALVATCFSVACSDEPVTAAVGPGPSLDLNAPTGTGWFHRYVAIGTSVSMGWADEGVYFSSQDNSWPALLARKAGREISQPYIAFPGCRSPFQLPLVSFKRLSGEALTVPDASLSCAPNQPGVTLPTQNVAINAATTSDALNDTPENASDAGNKALYARVLPPGTTQVQAMERQNPKFVSVELGANEVLRALSGVAIVHAAGTIVPPAAWAVDYDQLLDRVEAVVNKGAVLVGLVHDASTFPPLRAGAEIYADRAALSGAFNVTVNEDCNGSQNLVMVPRKLVPSIAEGLQRKQLGFPPASFSCAPGGPTTVDFILTPSEVATINGVLAQMNAHIAAEAQARGWAHFELEALYGRPDLKAPFSSVTLMTSPTPWGPYISGEGFHPSALGQEVLAQAAAAAIGGRFGIMLAGGRM